MFGEFKKFVGFKGCVRFKGFEFQNGTHPQELTDTLSSLDKHRTTLKGMVASKKGSLGSIKKVLKDAAVDYKFGANLHKTFGGMPKN